MSQVEHNLLLFSSKLPLRTFLDLFSISTVFDKDTMHNVDKEIVKGSQSHETWFDELQGVCE